MSSTRRIEITVGALFILATAASLTAAAVVAVLAFCTGAAMYYMVFYQSRLVPRWLSGWGMAGAVLLMTGCLMALFHDTAVTGYVALALPIGVQEIVFAAWLLIKGFNKPALRSAMPLDGRTGTLDSPHRIMAP